LFVGTFARIGGVVAMESAALVSGYAWGTARRQFASFFVLVVALAITIRFSLFWVSVAVVAAQTVYYVLGLRFVANTFGISWLSIAGAHLKGIVISCAGLAASFAIVELTNPVSPFVREGLALLFYVATSGLLLLVGPNWLAAPVGPAARSLIVSTRRRLAARRTIS
jgi:hypothetical protein